MALSSVFEMIVETWRLSMRRRQFWVFGLILSLPLLVQATLLSDIPEEPSLLYSYATTHTKELVLFFLITCITSLIGKSGLILSFQRVSKNDFSPLSLPTLAQAMNRSFKIECATLFFLLCLGLVVAVPFIVSLATFDLVPSSLRWLALFLIVPVTLVMLIIREFTFFYFLLTPGLRFRSALEASSALFQKHSLSALHFILLVLMLTLLFTFFLNLAMLSIVALLHLLLPKLADAVLVTVGSFFALSVFEVIRQGLWFRYFERLAKPKSPTDMSEVVEVESEAEMPRA